MTALPTAAQPIIIVETEQTPASIVASTGDATCGHGTSPAVAALMSKVQRGIVANVTARTSADLSRKGVVMTPHIRRLLDSVLSK